MTHDQQGIFNDEYDIFADRDKFVKSLPGVSPFSGLIPDGYDPNDDRTVEAVVFGEEGGQTLVNHILAVMAELDSLGIADNTKIATDFVIYHAAGDCCQKHGYTMDQLFPGIQRDFNEHYLPTIDQYERTYDAFQKSKFAVKGLWVCHALDENELSHLDEVNSYP